MSVTAGAVRALVAGADAGSLGWQSLLWGVGLLAVMVPLAGSAFRRTST